MKKTILSAVMAASMAFGASAAVAQDQATSLDQLLNNVKAGASQDAKANRDREARFKRELANQTRLLTEANNTLKNEEARSVRLEAEFAENDKQLAALEKELNEAKGNLKELFGHLTGFAGDSRETLRNSLTAAQFPGRDEPITVMIEKLNSATKLPTMEEIESLWFEVQREMAESGKVVKFAADVKLPDGSVENREVVRVGAFNVVSNGDYLSFDAKSGLSVLARQPSDFTGSAADLQGASSGLHAFGIDPTGPTGGSFLSAIIDTPTPIERWHQGREVGYVITAIGVVGVLLAIFKLIQLSGVTAKIRSQIKSSEIKTNNPLGRVLQVAEDNKSADVETLELKLAEQILKERPSIESGVNVIKIISMVAPLLGLLGTVTGMILTFQAITIFGAGDPKAMASGISSALMTTVLGLIVAIPTVLMHTFVNGAARKVIHILEEQSTGIVAERSEAK